MLMLDIIFSIIFLSADIGIDNSFKAYMDYRAITDTTSIQYELQEDAWTDENGFRRYGDFYMIALGSYYTGDRCGKEFVVLLEDGAALPCMTGDVKADEHTDPEHKYRVAGNSGGCIVEFIVDVDKLPESVRVSGDCSKVFPGEILGILRKSA